MARPGHVSAPETMMSRILRVSVRTVSGVPSMST